MACSPSHAAARRSLPLRKRRRRRSGGPPPPRTGSVTALEGDLVVQLFGERPTFARRSPAAGARAGRLHRSPAPNVGPVLHGDVVAGAVEERQLTAEALQDDLGGVLVLPALVLPLAGLQLALDVNL